MRGTTFPLRLVLPEVPGAKDACVARLQTTIAGHKGVFVSHVTSGEDAICVHFDPARITLAEVDALVRAAGARLADQYGHVSIPFQGTPGEDAGRGLEDLLRDIPGVLEVGVSVPAKRVRVEFDRRLTDAERLARLVDDAGFSTAAAGPPAESAATPAVAWYRTNRELVWSLCAAGFLAVGWGGQRFGGWPIGFSVPLYVLAYAFGAWDLVRHAVARLRRGVFTFDIDLLMLVAAMGAAVLGEWAEGAFLLAHACGEMVSMSKCRWRPSW